MWDSALRKPLLFKLVKLENPRVWKLTMMPMLNLLRFQAILKLDSIWQLSQQLSKGPWKFFILFRPTRILSPTERNEFWKKSMVRQKKTGNFDSNPNLDNTKERELVFTYQRRSRTVWILQSSPQSWFIFGKEWSFRWNIHRMELVPFVGLKFF